MLNGHKMAIIMAIIIATNGNTNGHNGNAKGPNGNTKGIINGH